VRLKKVEVEAKVEGQNVGGLRLEVRGRWVGGGGSLRIEACD
jgi:hypothetical protein